MFFESKKSSLELSIRTIVVVVLAMTLLGLGLGFIRGMFKDISGISGDVSAQIREKILDDLITGDKKISFPKTELIIDRGKSELITVGIRNKNEGTLEYYLSFNQISFSAAPGGSGAAGDATTWFQYSNEKFELAPSESDVRNIRLTVPSNANIGSYMLSFIVEEYSGATSQGDYATKDFFIVVRG